MSLGSLMQPFASMAKLQGLHNHCNTVLNLRVVANLEGSELRAFYIGKVLSSEV